MESSKSLIAPFCIHIGLPKTATTMLQRRCFPYHPQIDYIGSQQTDSELTTHHYRTQAAQDLLEPIKSKPQRVTVESSREAYERVISAAAEAGRVPLWSREGLSIDKRVKRRLRAEALRRVLGDCTILITLRNPVALAESAYFQHTKRRATRSKQPLRRPLYWTADQWLDRFWRRRGGLVHLDYKHTIDTYASVFGKGSVKVMLFEDLVKDFDGFVQTMFNAIGVDPNALDAPIESERENDRWTIEQIERLQHIAKSPLRAIPFLFSKQERKLRLLGLNENFKPMRPGPKPRANFSEESIRYIEDATREGNRQLAEEWGLALEEHGYPMPGAARRAA